MACGCSTTGRPTAPTCTARCRARRTAARTACCSGRAAPPAPSPRSASPTWTAPSTARPPTRGPSPRAPRTSTATCCRRSTSATTSATTGCSTPASKVLGHDSFKGMGVDFADINGDGILDMYVSNIAQNYALEESHFVWVSTGDLAPIRDGVAPWVDRGESLGLSRSGWGWDTRFADFDGDGVPEALQAIGFLRGEKNRWPELHELAMGNDNNMNYPAAWPHFTPGDELSGNLHDPFF